MNTLQTITAKEQEILILLYRYRYLDRTQIQAFLRHKLKGRSSAWLKELRENHFVEWIYDPNDFAAKTKPAIYYLGLNGIRYLRALGSYPEEELRKRYRESSRQTDFIERCILLASACINLELPVVGATYQYVTEADYAGPDSDYHFLSDLKPQLYFIKEMGVPTATIFINYLLEVFVPSTPRYAIRKRLNDYIEYLEGTDWQEYFEDKPIVLIACLTKADLIYAKRRTRTRLEDIGRSKDTSIRFATIQEIRELGVTGKVWEDV